MRDGGAVEIHHHSNIISQSPLLTKFKIIWGQSRLRGKTGSWYPLPMSNSKLTHLDEAGHASMVNVGMKPDTERCATATGKVRMEASTLDSILEGTLPKGDVFAVARIAGIQAAKQCSNLIPLCHLLLLNSVQVALEPDPELPGVQISATCRVNGKTGVEMEALTAVSVAALTLYDMCKAVDRGMTIEDIQLESKAGGASGTWQRGGTC